MNRSYLARTLHKWLGLVLGLQLLIWLASGLYMVVVDLEVSRGLPVYSVRRLDGTILINAIDGSAIVTGEQDAQMLAQQDFTGSGEVLSVISGVAPDMETRDSAGAYWQVNFSDKAHTSIYISASTG